MRDLSERRSPQRAIDEEEEGREEDGDNPGQALDEDDVKREEGGLGARERQRWALGVKSERETVDVLVTTKTEATAKPKAATRAGPVPKPATTPTAPANNA